MSKELKRPQRFTKGELARAGVELVDKAKVILRCWQCKQDWSPDLGPGGRLPNGYWKCPNGCNEDAE